MIEALLAILIFCAAAYFVLVPLRRTQTEPGEGESRHAALAELEARKQVIYREIRDTELDHASGKLDDSDFRRQDAELRKEAVKILDRIESLKGPGDPPAPPG